MIVEHIEQDAGIAPARSAEHPFGGLHDWMAVGIGVDPAVQPNFCLDLRAVISRQPRLDEIAEQRAQHRLIAVPREKEMGEIVHGWKLITDSASDRGRWCENAILSMNAINSAETTKAK